MKLIKLGYDGSSAEYIVERGLVVDGIELELKGRVNDNLDVTFGYTSMEGKNGTKDAREIPETMYSMWANYEVNPKARLGCWYYASRRITN